MFQRLRCPSCPCSLANVQHGECGNNSCCSSFIFLHLTCSHHSLGSTITIFYVCILLLLLKPSTLHQSINPCGLSLYMNQTVTQQDRFWPRSGAAKSSFPTRCFSPCCVFALWRAWQILVLHGASTESTAMLAEALLSPHTLKTNICTTSHSHMRTHITVLT